MPMWVPIIEGGVTFAIIIGLTIHAVIATYKEGGQPTDLQSRLNERETA
jgi:hypothetical protein